MAADFRAHHAGALRTITAGHVRQAGILQRLKTVKVHDGGALRTVAILTPPLTVTASAATAFGAISSMVPASVTTDAVTAVPSGGFPPYAYAWSFVSGTAATANTPTGATTSFTDPSVPPGGNTDAVFQCVVTDSIGQTASINVIADFTNT